MVSRDSGYDTVAGMRRPRGANPFEGRFRRGVPAVGASEIKPYGVRDLTFWIADLVRGLW
jgi:hypothetical protein